MLLTTVTMKNRLSIVLIITLIISLIAYFFIVKIYKPTETRNINNPVSDSIKDQTGIKPLITDSVTEEFLTGKFNPAKDTSFTEVDIEFASREGMYMKKDAYKAFISMFYAAKKDGIRLVIISATRNFNYQKNIWEQKWNGQRLVEGKNLSQAVIDPLKRALIILKYSSMPGTSRHHWGTDIDLNSMDTSYFNNNNGKKIFSWLTTNAHRYGFCQPFNSKKIREQGYEEEKWHWSYMPLSNTYLKAYQNKITYSHIKGFSGSETAEEIKVIDNYVNSINNSCLSY